MLKMIYAFFQRPRQYQGLAPDAEKENLLKQSLDYLDQFIEKSESPYLTGENITIADISILASLTELDAMEYSYRCYGDVARWSDRMKVSLKIY